MPPTTWHVIEAMLGIRIEALRELGALKELGGINLIRGTLTTISAPW